MIRNEIKTGQFKSIPSLKSIKIVVTLSLSFIAFDYLVLYSLFGITFISCHIESWIYTIIFFLLDLFLLGLSPFSLKLTFSIKKYSLRSMLQLDSQTELYYKLRKIYLYSMIPRAVFFPALISFPSMEYYEQEKNFVKRNASVHLPATFNNYIFISPLDRYKDGSHYNIYKKLNPVLKKSIFSYNYQHEYSQAYNPNINYFFIELGQFNEKQIPIMLKEKFVYDSLNSRKMNHQKKFHLYFIAGDLNGYFYYSNNTITRKKLEEIVELTELRSDKYKDICAEELQDLINKHQNLITAYRTYDK
jgi:hypothetical protein